MAIFCRLLVALNRVAIRGYFFQGDCGHESAWLILAIRGYFFSRGDSAADVPQKTWIFVRGYFSFLFFWWLFFFVAIFKHQRGYFCLRGYFSVAIFLNCCK